VGGEVLIPASYAAEFGVGATAKQGRAHHSNDFPQELLLAAQAPCDLGHEVFRKPQVIESLLEGLGSMLRLAAVALEAFSGSTAPALYRFGLSFMILSGTAHGVLLHRLE
jgi:hypothetical protein